MTAPRAPSVAIVAQNASTRFGGEAILPWHYFRRMFQRGLDVHLVVHERTRDELTSLLPEARERMHFVADSPAQVALWKAGSGLPARIQENTFGVALHAITGLMQRKVVKELIRERGIELVHEPIPVAPKLPSFMFDLGVPLIVGPMNGGMDFPPAFAGSASALERFFMAAGREASHAVNRLIPGKCQAALLLTANPRTRAALPRCCASQRVEALVENGVDLALFGRPEPRAARGTRRCRFAFVGRLVDWKRVDLLLAARAMLSDSTSELHILGDGPLRAALEAQAGALGLSGVVTFHGMVPQAECSRLLQTCDALVLPSLRECGGAVVLEAMAGGLPVIATRWGGPADYLDDSCGILVDPSSQREFVDGLAAALRRLESSPELCLALGRAGQARVAQEFDWERKIERMLALYAEVLSRPPVN